MERVLMDGRKLPRGIRIRGWHGEVVYMHRDATGHPGAPRLSASVVCCGQGMGGGERSGRPANSGVVVGTTSEVPILFIAHARRQPGSRLERWTPEELQESEARSN